MNRPVQYSLSKITMFGKIALGAAALTTAAGGGLAATQGGDISRMMDSHPRMEARHEMRQEVHAAIEANDFDAWVAAVTGDVKNPFADNATADVFEQMVSIHEMMQSGDTEAAMEAREALRTDLGLPAPPKRGEGMERAKKGKNMMFDAEVRASLDQALADENFDAWATILIEAGSPEERVTQEHFDRMREHVSKRMERSER